eukprot:1498674-Amphidinium_carterae.1
MCQEGLYWEHRRHMLGVSVALDAPPFGDLHVANGQRHRHGIVFEHCGVDDVCTLYVSNAFRRDARPGSNTIATEMITTAILPKNNMLLTICNCSVC